MMLPELLIELVQVLGLEAEISLADKRFLELFEGDWHGDGLDSSTQQVGPLVEDSDVHLEVLDDVRVPNLDSHLPRQFSPPFFPTVSPLSLALCTWAMLPEAIGSSLKNSNTS